jgi:hypothetical protein
LAPEKSGYQNPAARRKIANPRVSTAAKRPRRTGNKKFLQRDSAVKNAKVQGFTQGLSIFTQRLSKTADSNLNVYQKKNMINY